jgi:signal transduction histidine kinase/ActR/RegA family two-component response regulator
MHQSHHRITVDAHFGDAWAARWIELLSAASERVTPDVAPAVRHFVAALLAPATETAFPSLLVTADVLFAPAQTGLPVDAMQALGARALLDTLTVDAATGGWPLLMSPWLHHPLFAVSALHDLAQAPDSGSVLTCLIAHLHTLVPAAHLNLWRAVAEDAPLIEVTHGQTARVAPPDAPPALKAAWRTGAPQLLPPHIVIPLHAGTELFALIELTLPAPAAGPLLHLLLLARVAESALARLSPVEEAPNPITWQRVLAHLTETLTVTQTAADIFTAVATQVRQVLPCERVTFWTHLPESDEFSLHHLSVRLTRHTVPLGSRCPADGTPLHVAWFTGQPVLLGSDWPHLFPNYPNPHGSIQALAVIPIVFEYAPLGVLTLERIEGRPFTRGDADWLMLMAGMVATALRNLATHQTLRDTQARMWEDSKMRALGEMAAGIAHDFNNILMGLMCQLDLLRLAPDLAQVRERLPRLKRAIQDASAIINRVCTFGRKENRDGYEPLRLAEIVRDSVDLLAPLLTRRAITLQMGCDPEVWVLGDGPTLREVVTNLVTNAVHAMPQGGTLTVSCAGDERHAWFSIDDSGIGMSPAVLARACEPFFSTKGGQGTGLGLSLSYRILQQHQGVLRLDSQEGVGTSARAELPRFDPTPLEVATPALQILLVEDNDDIAVLLGELLTHLGHSVQLALSARAACARCADVQFDLILTDLSLAGETGDTVALMIRRQSPEIPVLLLTGSLDLEAGSSAIYDAVLAKPITLEALQQAISRAWTRRQPVGTRRGMDA